MIINKLRPQLEKLVNELPEGLILQLVDYKPSQSENSVLAIVVGEESFNVQMAVDEIANKSNQNNIQNIKKQCQSFLMVNIYKK